MLRALLLFVFVMAVSCSSPQAPHAPELLGTWEPDWEATEAYDGNQDADPEELGLMIQTLVWAKVKKEFQPDTIVNHRGQEEPSLFDYRVLDRNGDLITIESRIVIEDPKIRDTGEQEGWYAWKSTRYRIIGPNQLAHESNTPDHWMVYNRK